VFSQNICTPDYMPPLQKSINLQDTRIQHMMSVAQKVLFC